MQPQCSTMHRSVSPAFDRSGGHLGPVQCRTAMGLEADSLVCGADSRRLLTACDDMHSHLYDVTSHSLASAYSGELQAGLHEVCGLHGCTQPSQQQQDTRNVSS